MVNVLIPKLIVFLLLLAQVCYADDATMYGTVDNPQINGIAVDPHKAYIEPNPGFAANVKIAKNESSNEIVSAPVKVASKQIIVKQANNLQSDSWATDSKIARVLKQAASDGKLNYVLNQAQEKKLPAAVAIVPIVESNYNKNAVSVKGAGGAWQIMPKTANDYGLSSADRFDFNSSTKVAIEILNDLYQTFGNWALVFAAYNCGSTCVSNALKQNPQAQSIDELSLPMETKKYVHQIVQFSQLIAGLDNVKHEKPN
jgi:hypothetical protein